MVNLFSPLPFATGNDVMLLDKCNNNLFAEAAPAPPAVSCPKLSGSSSPPPSLLSLSSLSSPSSSSPSSFSSTTSSSSDAVSSSTPASSHVHPIKDFGNYCSKHLLHWFHCYYCFYLKLEWSRMFYGGKIYYMLPWKHVDGWFLCKMIVILMFVFMCPFDQWLAVRRIRTGPHVRLQSSWGCGAPACTRRPQGAWPYRANPVAALRAPPRRARWDLQHVVWAVCTE